VCSKVAGPRREHFTAVGASVAVQIAGVTLDFGRLERAKLNQKRGGLIEFT
jgi:hypothetical protein